MFSFSQASFSWAGVCLRYQSRAADQTPRLSHAYHHLGLVCRPRHLHRYQCFRCYQPACCWLSLNSDWSLRQLPPTSFLVLSWSLELSFPFLRSPVRASFLDSDHFHPHLLWLNHLLILLYLQWIGHRLEFQQATLGASFLSEVDCGKAFSSLTFYS